MLDNLKKQINAEMYDGTLLEAAIEQIASDDDDIRDTMLDDPDALVIGAEEDPQIEKLVNSLPDTVIEDDEITEKDIARIAEEYIPESILEADASAADEETSKDDDDSDDADDDDIDDDDADIDDDDIDLSDVD